MADHVDVLIVGAGLSGIGAACHLRRRCPDKSMAILESRDVLGGTWDLFRYPGVRSDSDMLTLGYSFRPWTEATTIAGGPAILRYLHDTAREYGVDAHIRYGHRVLRAEWSSEWARWTVFAHRDGAADEVSLTCSFLSVCSGYYRYDQGYSPSFDGAADFAGTFVHPQHWPADLDYAGKQVVVIGSGATAMTLVPAMADRGAQVTMLQRSPSYVTTLPVTDPVAAALRGRLPRRWLYSLLRRKNVLLTMLGFQLSRRRPKLMKSLLRRSAVKQLPDGYDVDTHFSPRYEPWDQRLCVLPDGDLFRVISQGTATVVTEQIDRLTRTGVLLASGAKLPADIIVTATGLNLLVIGDITLSVDGRIVFLPDTLAYKGMMLSGVPNFSLTVGYTNASWTLKSDLVAGYVCRLLKYLDANGYQTVTPLHPDLRPEQLHPLIDLQSGYVQRGIGSLPRQGPDAPWRLHQNYLRDRYLLRRGSLTDGVRFGHAAATDQTPPS